MWTFFFHTVPNLELPSAFSFFSIFQVDASVANHLHELPELTHGVKVLAMSHATRESLTEAWKSWIEEAGVNVCVCVGACMCLCVCVCVCVHVCVCACACV
jgi:hypothetical protein